MSSDYAIVHLTLPSPLAGEKHTEVSVYDHTEVGSPVQGQFKCFTETSLSRFGEAFIYCLFRF